MLKLFYIIFYVFYGNNIKWIMILLQKYIWNQHQFMMMDVGTDEQIKIIVLGFSMSKHFSNALGILKLFSIVFYVCCVNHIKWMMLVLQKYLYKQHDFMTMHVVNDEHNKIIFVGFLNG